MTGRRRLIRCLRCGQIMATAHPWDVATCGCGDVMVSGRPWRPDVWWSGRPGGGWRDMTDEPVDGAESPEAAARPPRRIGYA